MKIEITGNFNLNVGNQYTYTAKFDSPIESDKQLQISLLSNSAGLFILSTNPYKYANTLNIKIDKGTKEFYFTIIWLKETKTEIWITDPSISTPIIQKEVNITVKTITLQILQEHYQINDVIRIKIPLLSLPSKYSLHPQWEYDTSFLQKIGELEVLYSNGYQQFKILKWGKSSLKLTINLIDEIMRIGYEYCKGDLILDVPCPCKLVATEKYTCPNSIITYKIEGLLGGEEIKWKEECKNAKLSSGQGTDTAVYIAQSQGEVEVSATISYNGESTTISNKEVWAGKPTINPDLETSHVMTERNPVIIDASNEFFHYKGGISYAIESEDAEYVTVTETDKKFKVETTIPGTQRGEIKLRLKVSNDCGEVSNLHTIAYDTLPGLEPAKAIDLFSAKEHEFTCGRTYDMVKYVGELQTFQMFFTFTLERRATIMYIRPFCTEEKCLGFRIYDRKDEDLETPLYTHETSDTYMTIENMPQGEYMMVLDVERDYSNKLEIIFNGYIGGSSPTRPYVIEPDENGFEFSDCRNTETYSASFYYKNEQGESVGSEAGTNNTYYILTLKKPMQLIFHTAGSKVSTEFHIMQGEPYDWKVLYHETGGNYNMEEIQADPEVSEELKSMILNSLWAGQTYVKRIFPAGEYRFVLNGIKKSNGGLYNGDLNFNVIGQTVTENSFDTAFDLGSFTKHEFNINAFLSDIQAHKNLKIQKLYFRFHTEKNVCFILNALSESEFLPIVFYNSDKKQIATSDTGGEINIKDMAGGTYYFIVDISQAQGDKLTIEGKGIFRGRDPYFSYNLGTYDKDFTISDTIDTADGGFYETFKYTDENGNLIYTDEPAANHVYYKITLQKEMQLIIHTTYSELPLTELHIMTGEPFGWHILYYKDYGCEGIENDPDIPDEIKQNIAFGQICVKINLPAGEYKLVLNGTKRTNGGIRNGVLVTNVIGKTV